MKKVVRYRIRRAGDTGPAYKLVDKPKSPPWKPSTDPKLYPRKKTKYA